MVSSPNRPSIRPLAPLTRLHENPESQSQRTESPTPIVMLACASDCGPHPMVYTSTACACCACCAQQYSANATANCSSASLPICSPSQRVSDAARLCEGGDSEEPTNVDVRVMVVMMMKMRCGWKGVARCLLCVCAFFFSAQWHLAQNEQGFCSF